MSSLETLFFNDLPAVRLRAPDGASVTVTLQGAHVVSWVSAHGQEQLYLSPASRFEVGQAIRGGVPVIFPQFGARGPLPRHGFARTSAWSLVDRPAGAAQCSVTLRLQSNAQSWVHWPYEFVCDLTVALDAGQLVLQMEVGNLSSQRLHFQAALHTYFAVGQVGSARLTGLKNCIFEDTTRDGGERQVDAQPVLQVEGLVDRIYFDAPAQLQLQSDAGTIRWHQQGFGDVVVWNPGQAGGDALPDLPQGGYRGFVCVEAARIGQACELEPGARWSATHILEAVA